MTMLSFRVDDRDAARVADWAKALGVDRSELLRDALRRQLDRLASENDAARWLEKPLDDRERSLTAIAEWGPDEDWSDWKVDQAVTNSADTESGPSVFGSVDAKR